MPWPGAERAEMFGAKVGKERHRAQEEEQGGVADHEQVDRERPRADPLEAELERPELHDRQQQEDRPAEMLEIDAVAIPVMIRTCTN